MEFLDSAVFLPSCMTFLIFQLALPRNYPQISVTKKRKKKLSLILRKPIQVLIKQLRQKKQHKQAVIGKQSHGIKTPRWRTVDIEKRRN